MKKRLAVLFLLLVTSGCASGRDEANALAHDASWQWNILPAGTFDLATAQPAGRHGQTLWVYIEGDGLAYLTPNQPSSDPTPSDPIALRLALAHPGDDPVAYLARPCQYVLPAHSRGCKKDYWVNARYAPDVIASISRAIDIVKSKAGATHLMLVGYSGGGAVAVLVAAKRHDVVGIVTVAANLDLAYWTKRDGLTPLAGSLDPANFAGDVATIPQVHFTGEHDDKVGTDVVRAFTNRLPAGVPVHIIEVPGFTHKCCWAEQWAQLITGPDVKSVIPAAP